MTFKTISNLFNALTLALFFVGCDFSPKTTGKSQKIATTTSKQDSKTSEAESGEAADADGGKKIKKKGISKEAIEPISDNAVQGTESPAQTMPNLPKSKLTWDGTSLIGTPQLFLIPIE